MTTIGDVLAVIGVVVTVVVSTWALVMTVSMLFGGRTMRAQARLEQAPWKTILLGAVMALVLGFIVVALLNQPNPLGKLIGWVIYLLMLVVMAIGLSGLAGLLARHLAQMEPSLSPYGALSRSAFLCVVATLLPILGWFVVAPLTLFVSLGAGAQAVLERTPPVAPSQPTNATATQYRGSR